MKTTLSHLPQGKKDELKSIVETLISFKQVEMVILFGSYATGKFVDKDVYEEDGITYEYQSDYDLLILLNKNKLSNDRVFTYNITDKLEELNCPTPISPIYEGINFVNNELSDGSYFFNDIIEQGIMLHNSERQELAQRRELSITEIKKQAQEHLDEWFESANIFLRHFQVGLEEETYTNAVFQLHQSTERYYHTVTLVHTNYKHKTHNIDELGKISATLNLEFKKIFPRKTEVEKHHFDLLEKAYIDSRYKKGYAITKEELEYLAKRVAKLRDLTERVCKEKIESFK